MWPLLTGCALFDPDVGFLDAPAADPAVRAPPASAPTAIPLARPGQPARFELPASSRPGGAAAPERFGLIGPFRSHTTRQRVEIWRTPLPIQPSLMPSASGGTHRFGSKPPQGMALEGPHGELHFDRGARAPGSWGFDEEWLYVGLPPGRPEPDIGEYSIVFPRATDTEDRLNLATSGLDAEGFARRTMTVGGESYAGLFLPAPAAAVFPLTVPERGVLSFDARLLEPAVATGARSDGAVVVVELRSSGGEVQELRRVDVALGSPTPTIRVDLSARAGEAVDLVLRTEPGPGDATFDYVHLGAPTVYAAGGAPRRIVLVFVDTLRADHLGFMGYRRPISPTLDRLASHATVFTQARTVAPWTLPSARAALSGQEPELWSASLTLAEVLGAAGWRTDAIVSNAFLSQPFDVHRGWDRFGFEHLRAGTDVVDLGIRALRDGADRDQLLMVHFMEPHLPYEEPWTYRHAIAGSRPAALESLTRTWLSELDPGDRAFRDIREYVTDRYDQQILYVDHLIAPLLEAAGPDATVVLFSDHGEELWEHGGFEHGHAFWDEVLHVPLVIRSPALPPGRIEAPVSLLDLTPTLIAIAGLPGAEGAGRSLVPLAWGDPGAAEALAARPVAFGRPLYGGDGWGVLADDYKWWDRAGEQALFDLRGDPGEARDLSRRAPALDRWPDRLSAALGREVRRVWRLDLRLDTSPVDLEITVSHPDGFAQAWLGFDPRGRSSGIEPRVREDHVVVRVPVGSDAPQSVYLVPNGDPLDPAGFAATLMGGKVRVGGRSERGRLSTGPEPQQILAVGDEKFGLTVNLTWTPEPAGVAVPGFHPEMEAQLRELGYLDEPGG
jgi:arylsulfatase A-like enzyme